MSKIALLFLCLLFAFLWGATVSQPMPPGGPGGARDDFYSLARRVLTQNAQVDEGLSRVTADIRNGKASYQYAISEFQYYRDKVAALTAKVDVASSAGSLKNALIRALNLQVQRCSELLDCVRFERDYGYQAAKPKWQKELKTYYRYQDALRKVKDLLR
ncbi:MAG: hypothetical protein HYU64_01785 [Armatimonadetes bacterium]|nr:hypothetical protein [Armatimonadota bacterium]